MTKGRSHGLPFVLIMVISSKRLGVMGNERRMFGAVVFDIGGVLAYDVWEYLLLGDEGIALTYNLPNQEVERLGNLLWEEFAHLTVTDNNLQSLEEQYWAKFLQHFKNKLPSSI